MKNIYFIEAKSPGAHIYSRTALPRLGTILLSTILKERGYNAKAFIEDISEPDWKELEKADLIGISSITSTAPRAFKLASRFRSKGIPIVMGGVHSTFLPEESLEYADYVVRGEGEETIVELIEHLESGTSLKDIRGLSYREGDAFIHNPERPLLKDLDAAPIPDLSVVHNWKRKPTIPLATSRGCPFGCRFCSVIQMFGRKYRFKSVDRIIEEIKSVASRKVNHIFFIDDNFAANKKQTKVLLKRMIAENIRIEWSAQVRTEVTRDTELIDLMVQAGCFGVFVGFESINPRTLSLFNKKQEVDDIVNCIETFKKASIYIHGMFILGGDTDDIETIRSTKKFAKRLGIPSVQFLMLTPLPGTPVFYDLRQQGRLLHTDWAKYDAHHAVFEPKLMTPFELQTETLKAMAGFYSWGTILKNLMKGHFFYSAVSLYGKRSLQKTKSLSKRYMKDLKEMIRTQLEEKTGIFSEYFLTRKKAAIKIVLNNIPEEGIESKFFKTFFEKIGKKSIISSEGDHLSLDTLTIMPILHDRGDGDKTDKGLLSETYEKYKAKVQNVKIIPLEADSLYKVCFELGMILGIRMKKIRKAYEKALEKVNGRSFDCRSMLVMLL
jgi:radical SAM superfamily enzyme YgiQ (UPF0313 family)